jgi:hypothetical protein
MPKRIKNINQTNRFCVFLANTNPEARNQTTPTMDTENKYVKNPTESPEEIQDEQKSAKKVRRQPTQTELDHPLHGVKLVDILESLVEHYGWEYLANEVNIMCFKVNPTMKVSLKFLRKMKWAREHVEDVYLRMLAAGIDPKANKKATK